MVGPRGCAVGGRHRLIAKESIFSKLYLHSHSSEDSFHKTYLASEDFYWYWIYLCAICAYLLLKKRHM